MREYFVGQRASNACEYPTLRRSAAARGCLSVDRGYSGQGEIFDYPEASTHRACGAKVLLQSPPPAAWITPVIITCPTSASWQRICSLP